MSCFPARRAPSRCSFLRGTPSRSRAEGSFHARGAPSRSPAEDSLFARRAPSRSQSALLLFGPCLAVLTCLSGPVVAAPDDVAAEEAGFEIAREARARKSGCGNFTARQVMVLRNKRGQESRRELRVRVLEVEGDGDKSMFVFDQPAMSREPRFSSTRTRRMRTNNGSICPRSNGLSALARRTVPVPSWAANSPTRT